MLKYRSKNRGQWLFPLAGASALLLWNWHLGLSTSAGIGMMLLVSQLQQRRWNRYYEQLQKLFSGGNRQLMLATACGGVATVGTYLALAIWMDSAHSTLALSEILQGLAIATILALVWKQNQTPAIPSTEATVDASLTDLMDSDSLRRFIAVRRLTRPLQDSKSDREMRRTILNAFRLLLTQEQEPLVRNALLDAIKPFQPPAKPSKTAPVAIPLNLQTAPTPIDRR